MKKETYGYLLDHAALQDNLLQNYRVIGLTLQSILLLIGTTLLPSIASSQNRELFFALEVALFFFAIYATMKLRKIIQHREQDVDYWHKALLKFEQSMPKNERYFTVFKKFQKDKTKDASTIFSELSNKENIEILLDKHRGHTRRVLDEHINFGMILLWQVVMVIAIVSFL